MRLVHPDAALWLLALPVTWALCLLHRWLRDRVRRLSGYGPGLARLSRVAGRRHDTSVMALATVAGLSLVVAAMRPQAAIRTPEYESRDLLLLIDRSASMQAADIRPSRARRASLEVRNVIRAKPDSIARIGLIAFAGSSLTLSQPTTDGDAVLFYLDWIDEDRVPLFGTNLRAALENALELIRRGDRKRPTFVVVLSDGDDFGAPLEATIAKFVAQRIPIYSIGIGSTDEVPIPTDGSHRLPARRAGRAAQDAARRGHSADAGRFDRGPVYPIHLRRRAPGSARTHRGARAAHRRLDSAPVPRSLSLEPGVRGGRARRAGGDPVTSDPGRAIGADMTADAVFATTETLAREVSAVVVGQTALVHRLLTALFSSIPYSFNRAGSRAGCGHVLLEGVPGVAKTLVATTIARAISASFQRIQLTPDMMPADIVGTRVYDAATSTFRIERGPVFANILLADEVNRTTPKTQSALLEAMQERQVTLADHTFELPDPFWVLATQNPVEQEGVYSLPEAQLDRFSMMLRVGYPPVADEIEMLRAGADRPTLQRCLAPGDVSVIRDFVRDAVHVEDAVREYIVRLARATRRPEDVGRPALRELLVLGISPRACQHVLAVARTAAFLQHGRSYVLPSDVKDVFADVARHRIVRSIRAEADRIDADEILGEVLAAVPLT